MQATKRTHESSVIGVLLAEPHQFEFTQLLNLLLRELRRQGIPYERAMREVLRFQNNLSLSFPASEVHSLEVEPDVPDSLASLRMGELKRIRITPAFIGLLGAGGTLPMHDTERIAAQKAHAGDASQRELLDVLSNRLIGMFYEAWAKYRVEHSLDVQGQDRLLPMLTAMAGVRSASGHMYPAGQVKQETAAYFSGLLRTRPVSAGTVEQVLSAYFGLPVQLEQFVGCWAPVPLNRRSTLGVTAPTLGVSAALGVRQWRHDLRAKLHIGPLDDAHVAGFLPGGDALTALAEMASLFATPTVRYELRLLLAPPCIKRFTLSTRTAPRRLGWNTFLTGTDGVARRPEIRSMLRLPARVALPAQGGGTGQAAVTAAAPAR
ncbi:type VI secretion system protein ImpH [Massilia sp. UYP32]|uniref:Type VI secretion protein n=1 Tax=Massilia timonae CCUG 45783 TaxID=883126 RepID=K9DE33_9BURK|nr:MULTISPECIES: type VI secretion system baseplate subunit TssG [Massilia]EKU82513.1 type VI secretion protein [Massilia timonae CCUG 45783]QYG03746.1 type VI secretion system baseplate subunit TssG [Massilia sp. NP310]